MSGTEAANASGVIASSADRMVGAEHAEVRYFTRYDLKDIAFKYRVFERY